MGIGSYIGRDSVEILSLCIETETLTIHYLLFIHLFMAEEILANNVPVAMAAGKTMLEEFMAQNYAFRHNEMSDKYEMRKLSMADGKEVWRTVTNASINSIALRLNRELDEKRNWKSSVEQYVYSEETPDYNPIVGYMEQLPVWDGKDRVSDLFMRLPGISNEQLGWLHTWLLSVVAHWLDLDPLHGNEQVVTLIGPQGCGKSTFCAQLLPPQFRSYYLDHVNLGNKFDKDMALTHNLIVNIDEIDQIKEGKQAELKQMLSKIKVNGRPIFGRAQQDRRRYASFTATTNNPRPLQDPTGSRRYLCVEIQQGSIICNERPIEYDQLFAQVKYEVCEQHLRYWFTPDEVRRIEEHNVKFQRIDDLESMLNACFRRPTAEETVRPLLVRDVVSILLNNFPGLKQTTSLNVKVGRMLKAMKYEQKDLTQGSAYYLVPSSQAS